MYRAVELEIGVEVAIKKVKSFSNVARLQFRFKYRFSLINEVHKSYFILMDRKTHVKCNYGFAD